ncbi:hypothetical protein M9Y10_036767 [Tritrichomonas musculus]|uniref:Uncharacterized protein n=1 Tax=Tritrichomonas musculus TaxID=1915356 RepID=A0ABR2GTR7_9EUKA
MPKNRYPAQVKAFVNEQELEYLILECYAVRRPISIPSIKYTIGEVLSHSGVICVTAQESFLIEYLYDCSVNIKRVQCYEPGKDFDFEDFHFIHDNTEPQVPDRPVTIKRFAISMANFMKGKKFETFSHNCHMARYFTMKKYGMKSNNPRKAKRIIFFQGWFDFFGKNTVRVKHEKKKRNICHKVEG